MARRCVMARGLIKPRVKKIPGQKKLKGLSGIPVKPTARQIKIAEGMAKGLTKKQALLEAGVSEANARSNSAELTSEPGVLKALDIAFEKANVNLDRIAMTIDEGLSAKKVISAVVLTYKPKKDQPDVIDAAALDDVSKRFIEVADHAVRHQFVRTASELMDLFPAKKVEDVTPMQKLSDDELDGLIHRLMEKKTK